MKVKRYEQTIRRIDQVIVGVGVTLMVVNLAYLIVTHNPWTFVSMAIAGWTTYCGSSSIRRRRAQQHFASRIRDRSRA